MLSAEHDHLDKMAALLANIDGNCMPTGCVRCRRSRGTCWSGPARAGEMRQAARRLNGVFWPGHPAGAQPDPCRTWTDDVPLLSAATGLEWVPDRALSGIAACCGRTTMPLSYLTRRDVGAGGSRGGGGGCVRVLRRDDRAGAIRLVAYDGRRTLGAASRLCMRGGRDAPGTGGDAG